MKKYTYKSIKMIHDPFFPFIVFLTTCVAPRAATICSLCSCIPVTYPEVVNCREQSLMIIPNDLPPSVSKLVLRGNNIHSVDNILIHYRELTHLDISYNKVTQIQSNSFKNSVKLAFLDLSYNQLNSLADYDFVGLASLREISLANNKLETLPPALFQYSPFLEVLNLEGNRLSQIPGNLFARSGHLQSLVLKDNSFHDAPMNVFKTLRHLSSLDLSDNDLRDLNQYSFQSLNKLISLKLSGCKLTYISSGTFDNLPDLHELDLSNNKLGKVPSEALGGLDNLRVLNIGLNYINGFGKDLEGLTSLETLVIKGCHRTVENFLVKEENFARNVKLETINITQCKGLTGILEETFKGLAFLKVLNLHDNGLTSIEESAADWRNLEYFDISGNPLTCDCSLNWLNYLLIERASLPSPYCSEPYELKGRSIIGLSTTELECSNDDDKSSDKRLKIIVISVMVSSGVIIIFVFCLLWCTEEHRHHRQQRRSIRKRFPQLKKPIVKNDIKVKADKDAITDNSKFLDVKVCEPQETELYESNHIYEELPLGPPDNKVNYPDVKISVL